MFQIFKSLLVLIVLFFYPHFLYAQEQEVLSDVVSMDTVEEKKQVDSLAPVPSEEFVRLSWEASSQDDLEKVKALVGQCVKVYGDEAKKIQAQLKDFPTRGTEKKYQALNDVGTCLFIRAEAAMNSGNTQEAIKEFQYIIDNLSFSQAWDPRGWYWSVAEKSQASIDILTGKTDDDFKETAKKVVRTKPILHTKGTMKIVDYTKFGEFKDVGKEKYHYRIKDVDGLSKALGEGIYPNNGAIYDNPRYKIVKNEGRLNGSHWDYVNNDDLEAAYFKWVTAHEPWGVRLFYLGMIF